MPLKNLISQAITAVAMNKRAEGRQLSAFRDLQGVRHQNELMIVGRAVNGWNEWNTGIARDETLLAEYIADLGDSSKHCPLDWVCTPIPLEFYNARRSAFWRTARKVLEEVTGRESDGECWASRLAWSNLYKLSLDKGNPPIWMINAQETACIKILQHELRRFRPKRVLFSTGFDWAEPFVAGSNLISLSSSVRHVQRLGCLPIGNETAQCVVATHPMTRPEAEWVSEVVSAYRGIENA